MHLHLFAQPGSSGVYSAASLSLYGLTNAPGAAALLECLGKHKTGAGCLYINRLTDVDEAVLAELISLGYRYGTTVLHSR